MSRPCKRRRICTMPGNSSFAPVGYTDSAETPVTMSLDEYETIRLIDLEKLNQEACAQRMGVARTTIQAIYSSAREKMAECLIHGRLLRIEGGDYVLCEGQNSGCHCRKCIPKGHTVC